MASQIAAFFKYLFFFVAKIKIRHFCRKVWNYASWGKIFKKIALWGHKKIYVSLFPNVTIFSLLDNMYIKKKKPTSKLNRNKWTSIVINNYCNEKHICKGVDVQFQLEVFLYGEMELIKGFSSLKEISNFRGPVPILWLSTFQTQ